MFDCLVSCFLVYEKVSKWTDRERDGIPVDARYLPSGGDEEAMSADRIAEVKVIFGHVSIGPLLMTMIMKGPITCHGELVVVVIELADNDSPRRLPWKTRRGCPRQSPGLSRQG